MFGLTFEKLLFLLLIAAVLLGPTRLPVAAAGLGRAVRALRRYATTTRARLGEEFGAELDELDWKRLDPRQYDPRRIIREALLDDDVGIDPGSTPHLESASEDNGPSLRAAGDESARGGGDPIGQSISSHDAEAQRPRD